MNKTYWYLVQPVVKYDVFEDKDLEDINFHGGVVCFRLYLEKMLELRHKTPNSDIKIKSITWQDGRDVLFVKFTQTFSFDYIPLKNAVDDYLKSVGVDDYKFSCLYNERKKAFDFTVFVNANEENADQYLKNVSSLTITNILHDIEPELNVDVDVLIDIKPERA